MASLLIVSADFYSIDKIVRLSFRKHIRPVTVSTLEDCLFLSDKEEFVAVFIDSYLVKENAPQIAQEIWKSHPLCFVGIFSFRGRVYSESMLRITGVGVFHGQHAFSSINHVIQNLPLVKSPRQNRKILYVEDLYSARKIISTHLESLAYGTVVAVENAQHAITALQDDVDSFYCVVTDINMPDISGITLTSFIRNQAKFKHLPVIVITSFGHGENLLECIKAGASGFLVKPPRADDIKKELDKAVRIVINNLSPRLCSPEKAYLLEESLLQLTERRASS